MKIIPAIDIIGGKCVRLTQGNYGQCKIYSANPLEMARLFEEAGLGRKRRELSIGLCLKRFVNIPVCP